MDLDEESFSSIGVFVPTHSIDEHLKLLLFAAVGVLVVFPFGELLFFAAAGAVVLIDFGESDVVALFELLASEFVALAEDGGFLHFQLSIDHFLSLWFGRLVLAIRGEEVLAFAGPDPFGESYQDVFVDALLHATEIILNLELVD